MSKKIFIIEDDINLLSGLQAKLRVDGFLVETSSGNCGINELVNNIKLSKPDYIILDLILPCLDGFEILKSVKSGKDLQGVPVFIFTNLSDEDTRSRSKKLGADYYFIKDDFMIDDFVLKFKKIISNKERATRNA
ncbi:response regulator [Patescibacteria group bacterium]|nr:response regulator [Candidatus Falkowbacteria bacterium]MBU3905447.1 response regulator [Patescibacteria group bacterium]MCG2698637.1 response regulator [Candidatus Parcubacteria bacterium]MBU4015322.1 response regulator [Patescibacteria group bacterium]MBU4026014.1 response regulator [Patescibacteria group bacterium]